MSPHVWSANFLHIASPSPAPTFSTNHHHFHSWLIRSVDATGASEDSNILLCGFVCVRISGCPRLPRTRASGLGRELPLRQILQFPSLQHFDPPGWVLWADPGKDPTLPFDKPPPVWNDLSEWCCFFVLRSAPCFP